MLTIFFITDYLHCIALYIENINVLASHYISIKYKMYIPDSLTLRMLHHKGVNDIAFGKVLFSIKKYLVFLFLDENMLCILIRSASVRHF